MVSALYRKDQIEADIKIQKIFNNYRGIHPDQTKDFPALREFINSHLDLPTIDEITSKNKQSTYASQMVK